MTNELAPTEQTMVPTAGNLSDLQTQFTEHQHSISDSVNLCKQIGQPFTSTDPAWFDISSRYFGHLSGILQELEGARICIQEFERLMKRQEIIS